MKALLTIIHRYVTCAECRYIYTMLVGERMHERNFSGKHTNKETRQ